MERLVSGLLMPARCWIKKFRDRDYQLGGPVSLAAFRRWLAQFGNKEDTAPLRRPIERVFGGEATRQDLGGSRSFADWRDSIEELLVAANWNLLAAAAIAWIIAWAMGAAGQCGSRGDGGCQSQW